MIYAYLYIFDIDGITLVEFNDVDADRYLMCNLEGESCPRYATVIE